MYLALVRRDVLHWTVDTPMLQVTVPTPGDYTMHKKAKKIK